MGWDILDLYSDYLLVSTRKTTATGLSELVDGAISHDQITRFLAGEELDGKLLWLKTKKLIRQCENGEGCLIFDDTIVEKAYMDENEIICRYYDHGKGRNVKGINILTVFYTAENEYGKLKTPIDYQIVSKTKGETDGKTGKERRVSGQSKNEMMREMIERAILGTCKKVCVNGHRPVRYRRENLWPTVRRNRKTSGTWYWTRSTLKG
jgi:hypothetical protein